MVNRYYFSKIIEYIAININKLNTELEFSNLYKFIFESSKKANNKNNIDCDELYKTIIKNNDENIVNNIKEKVEEFKEFLKSNDLYNGLIIATLYFVDVEMVSLEGVAKKQRKTK